MGFFQRGAAADGFRRQVMAKVHSVRERAPTPSSSRDPSPARPRYSSNHQRRDGELASLINRAFRGTQANLLSLSLQKPTEPRLARPERKKVARAAVAPSCMPENQVGEPAAELGPKPSEMAKLQIIAKQPPDKDWITTQLLPPQALRPALVTRPSLNERAISWSKQTLQDEAATPEQDKNL